MLPFAKRSFQVSLEMVIAKYYTNVVEGSASGFNPISRDDQTIHLIMPVDQIETLRSRNRVESIKSTLNGNIGDSFVLPITPFIWLMASIVAATMLLLICRSADCYVMKFKQRRRRRHGGDAQIALLPV